MLKSRWAIPSSWWAKALAAGAASQSAPEDKPYGHRNAGVVDGNGITWWIASPVR